MKRKVFINSLSLSKLKMRGKSILLIAFLIVMISLASIEYADAVGLSSNSLKVVLDFKPNLKRTFTYAVLTNAGRIMDYPLSVKGIDSDYFHLSTDKFEQVPSGESRTFSVDMELPEQVEAPGIHDTLICVIEGEGRVEGAIGTRVEMCASVAFRVLYYSKYLVIENMNVPNADRGDIIPIDLVVKSWTEQDISNLKATIDIFGPDEKGYDKKITTLYSDEKSLPSNGKKILSAYLNTENLDPGEYRAVATVFYDGNEANISKSFRIGLLTVKLLNYTQLFERGKVNKFDVLVDSRWNRMIDYIYADINIGNDSIRTPSSSLESWKNTTLTAYWDLTEKKTGTYKGNIILHYGENSSMQEINVKVVIGKEEIRRIMTSTIIGAIVVILIAILVILSLKTIKMNRKENEGKKIKSGKKHK